MNKIIKVPLPINIEKEALPLFKPFTKYSIEPLKVKTFKNVFVGYSGLAINKSGLIKESHHNYPDNYDDYLNEAFFYYNNAVNNTKNLIELDDENTYLLIHHPWYNYYHWICEAILRLWIVKDEINKLILLLPDYYEKSDFIMGSLKPFNLSRIFFIPRSKSVFLNKLCLPQIKPLCDSYHIDKLVEIREFYLNNAKSNEKNIDLGERIYLSRKKASRKKVVNEKEVEDVLSNYQFTVVDNEDYTFLEQVAIYSNAKYLISIHGSGLTNMLFMKDNSFILEFHKRKTNTLSHPSFVFWYQAAALKFNYFHQICEPITPDDDYFFGDFYIDTALLERNLSLMFSNISNT